MKRSLYYKICYIAGFVLLGVLLNFVVHVALEYPTLHIITSDIERYGDSFVWQNWQQIHAIGTGMLLSIGVLSGLVSGFYFWNKLED